MEKIKINYLPQATRMNQENYGNWIDCYTYKDTVIPAHSQGFINLGFACELPIGYEGHLAARSSTFKRYGIIQTNAVGIVDSSYCGNDDIWMFAAYNLNDFPVVIPAGSRVCQFRIIKSQPAIEFVETDDLKNEKRGGFGSTGG